MDMDVLAIILVYILLASVTAVAVCYSTGEIGPRETAYAIFWPVVLLAGMVWAFTVGIRILIKDITSWNWHVNS